MGRIKFQISNFKFQINQRGFTLIELLIVISIFGITASLITASYLTFERNQRLKAAAQQIKTDVRFTQNKALTGDKGQSNDVASCTALPGGGTLVGYYISFSSDVSENLSYTSAGDCLKKTDSSEYEFNISARSLSKGVQIKAITYGSSAVDRQNVAILFEPLKHDVTFFSSTFAPPFLTGGQLDSGKFLAPLPQEKISIQLERENSYYYVDILPTGDVYERQQ